ncbi:MAG TPA: aminoacyl-tRNA hydrolase [Candidatus Saccharimonadales bacterium]|nr:aminoacyl-tRNA hydrolase [Candidatus Saccharimonadales bacterium]
MKLIVGLGNIGAHFDGTRHNVGFACLDTLASEWTDKPRFKAHTAEITLGSQKVLLLKSKTYYNQSGEAVERIKSFYKLTERDILVIHDELALPFGTIRTRLLGSDAGNNGIKSVIAHIGSDFARVRVGIATEHTPKTDAADFVLGHFSKDEREQLPVIFEHVRRFVTEFVAEDTNFRQTSVKIANER